MKLTRLIVPCFLMMHTSVCLSTPLDTILSDPSLQPLSQHATITIEAFSPPHHVPTLAYDEIGNDYISLDPTCFNTPSALAFYLAIVMQDSALVRQIKDPDLQIILAIQLVSYLFGLRWLLSQPYDVQQQCKKEIVSIRSMEDYYIIDEYQRLCIQKRPDEQILPDIQDLLIKRHHGDKTIQQAFNGCIEIIMPILPFVYSVTSPYIPWEILQNTEQIHRSLNEAEILRLATIASFLTQPLVQTS